MMQPTTPLSPAPFLRSRPARRSSPSHQLPILAALCGLLATPHLASAQNEPPVLRRIGTSRAEGSSEAIVVPEGVPLLQTTQLLPAGPGGQILDPGNPGSQARLLVELITFQAQIVGSTLNELVRLRVVARDATALEAFQGALLARLGPETPGPTFCAVIGPLPSAEATLAVDALIAVTTPPRDIDRPGALRLRPLDAQGLESSASLQPPGGVVYISGQAEPGDSPVKAAEATWASLLKGLNHLGLARRDVVQLTCFLQPIDQAAEVERALALAFAPEPTPPLIFIPWRASGDRPIEIELVASAPRKAEGPVIEHLGLPGMTDSPVYSRASRIHRGPILYTSSLSGLADTPPEAQAEAAFERLKLTLGQAGSDFNHLAKAVYLVADDATSTAVNTIRPRLYDPKRPPAASKALVESTGFPGRTFTLDLIAVPADGSK